MPVTSEYTKLLEPLRTLEAWQDALGITAINTALASKQPLDADLTTLAAPTAWRLFYSDGSGNIAQLALGSANTFLMSNGASSVPGFGTPAGLPAGHLFGFTCSNNGSDATNDIDITTGKCRDSTDAVDINQTSALTKRLDANWAAGTNQGMRNSGAAITNTTYHIYAVCQAAGANPDYYAHTSATVSTVLTALQAETGGSGYLYARRIWTIIRASNAIRAFTQVGDHCTWTTQINDASTSVSTTAAQITLTVPPDTIARFRAVLQVHSSGICRVVFSEVVEGNVTPATTTGILSLSGAASDNPAGHFELRADSSSQIEYDAILTGTSHVFDISTFGYIDSRGRLA